MYLKIYYKKMMITWLLTSFNDVELEQIAKTILNRTQKVEYYKVIRVFKCTTKKDLNIIYKILMQWYWIYCSNTDKDKAFIDYSFIFDSDDFK